MTELNLNTLEDTETYSIHVHMNIYYLGSSKENAYLNAVVVGLFAIVGTPIKLFAAVIQWTVPHKSVLQ